MPYFERFTRVQDWSARKSIFLFGPRQTGKTSLLKRTFPDSPFYNLLLSDQFVRLSARPALIREELTASAGPAHAPVIVDEVQRLPVLLDEVQNLIDEHGYRFVLTGSSARKLKRGGANLLGGRARVHHLFPLVFPELPDYDLVKIVNRGALPSIYTSDAPDEDLEAYCGTYLQEEIQAEGAVRRIQNFSRFLQVAALVNAELVSLESVSRDTAIPARTIRDHFTILEDTLVGTMLPPFRRTVRRKAVGSAKFYFFDVGVANRLARRTEITPKTELFGKCFEHLMFTELRAWLDYTRDRRQLSFWRDYAGHEVDFLVGDEIAVEVKGTDRVSDKHLKPLRMLSDEIPLKQKLVVSLDPAARRMGEIDVLPWKEFLSKLWGGAYACQ
jgi:predicted AAA+ superfamily ATPase